MSKYRSDSFNFNRRNKTCAFFPMHCLCTIVEYQGFHVATNRLSFIDRLVHASNFSTIRAIVYSWLNLYFPTYCNIKQSTNTFSSYVKCSLLKLLCTLTLLCEGKPLKPLRLNFIGSTFPHIHAQNCHFSLFVCRKIWKGEINAELMSTLHSPPWTPLWPPPPPHLTLIPSQGNHHTCIAPFCIAVHFWKSVSLSLRKIHSTCSSFTIGTMEDRGGGGVESKRRRKRRRRRI